MYMNVILLIFIFLSILPATEALSNTKLINGVKNYLNGYETMVIALQKQYSTDMLTDYLVKCVDDSNYIVGLNAHKLSPPGLVIILPDLTVALDNGKVTEKNIDPVTYATFVPFRQSNNMTVSHSAVIPIKPNPDYMEIAPYIVAKSIEFVYGFYTLFIQHKTNRISYLVYSASTKTYIHILTTLKDQNGHIALGTSLTDQNVLTSLNKTKTFNGNMTAFGTPYQALFKFFRFYNRTILIAAYTLNY
ncbi:unnamed protein product [Didymodactylos carnosus]|uniref:Single cache domain-containing protein n=1 Tax=Didymodactylos carnosus TaxID=1234261 RepID=A0A814BCF0_9BILA|nr:unnamed protein product [Didymodactylos carnosus]CAF3704820.1 unnamed protein product [Didymodactylos carnosus]